uniref:FBD domain-containing protein n=1 Tax=Steinernema glaseri TaxID=37863 RepID=A0A1I8A4X0_9BILA
MLYRRVRPQSQQFKMDGVPFAFCSHLFDLLPTHRLRVVKELSGCFGQVAQLLFENRIVYVALVDKGVEIPDRMYYEGNGNDLELTEVVPKHLVRGVTIFLRDAEGGKVSQKIVKRYPNAFVAFALLSSSICPAWFDFALSLKRFGALIIMEKLDEDALRLFSTRLQCLPQLSMHSTACEGDTLGLAKTLLCQKQFRYLQILNIEQTWDGVPVRELLEFWSENDGKLRCKSLYFEGNCVGGVKQIEDFMIQRTRSITGIHEALKACSNAESDFIKEKHKRLILKEPSCVFKFEEETGEGKRRICMFFDCSHRKTNAEASGQQWPEVLGGPADLHLMRGTRTLCVSFE